MQTIYIYVIIFICIFFIFRRRIDLFTLWFVGQLSMSQPYFYGYFYIPPLINQPENINTISYLIVLVVSIVICISAVYHDYRYKRISTTLHLNSNSNSCKIYSFSSALALASIVLLIISIFYIGVEGYKNRRVSDNFGTLESALMSKTILFSMYSVFLGFYSKNYAALIIGSLSLFAMYILSPSRSFMFITYLSVIMLIFIPKGKVTFYYLFKYSPIILFLLIFIVLGKVLRESDETFLLSIKNYIDKILGGSYVMFREANYIAANLHHSIESINPGEMFDRLFYFILVPIPFFYILLTFIGLPPITAFSKIILNIHDYDRAGVGSSFWGEIYATGGWLGVFLSVSFFGFILIRLINKNAYNEKIKTLSLMLFIPTIYTVAYASRLDVMILLNRFSDAILIYLLYLVYIKLKFRKLAPKN